jgi:hypothetical protein
MLDRLGIERRMSKHANHGSAHPTPAEVKLVMAEHHRIKGERVIRKSLLGEELEQKRAFEKRRSTRGLKGYALHRVFSLPEQVTQPSTIDHVPSLGRL